MAPITSYYPCAVIEEKHEMIIFFNIGQLVRYLFQTFLPCGMTWGGKTCPRIVTHLPV